MKLCVLIFFFVPYLTSGQLSTLLLEALKKNPGLITTLQSNPELLKSVLSSQQQSRQPKDQCEPLRKQNKVLKQMVLAVTGSDPTVAAESSDLFITEELPRNQRILDPTQALLQRVVDQPAGKPSISLKSKLITPSATWTTSMTTTSYVTTVTHTETSEVPIILRGSRVVTTILESDTQVVTATEIKTSSILVTPEPTWSIETVTITPSKPQILSLLKTPEPLIQPNGGFFNFDAGVPKKRRTNVEAQVVEIAQNNRPRGNNDFKSAYGAFFASSAQRSAERFGDILRPVRSHEKPVVIDDYDYYDDFDQQWLAAQNRPVYVESPVQKSKVFTLYFSGTKPGEFTTKMTTLAVDANGQPVLNNRSKRDTIDPSKVETIANTLPPPVPVLDSDLTGSFAMENGQANDFDIVNDLESSIKVVTVTVTKTEACPVASGSTSIKV